MIQHLSNNPGRPMSLEEYKEYEKEYEKTLIKSYEAFQAAGHEWCWCLVGNIKEQREYGEEHEIKKGTKAFSGGSKVHIAPVQWGDGGENVIVIGVPRYGKSNIEIIMRSKDIENYRLKRVFKPEIIKLMCASEHLWWNDTFEDRDRIIEWLDYLAPEEAKKERERITAADKVTGYIKYLADKEHWYFELDEDGYATKQILIDDKGCHMSCFEDCLAEGVVDPSGFDDEGTSQRISKDEFYDEWNNLLSKHIDAWNATKTKYPIGSICSGKTKAFYPQGQIVEGDDFIGVCQTESTLLHEIKNYSVCDYDESNMWLVLKPI